MQAGAAAVAEQGIGSLLNTYTTAKSIISASSVYQIPANKLYVGKKYRINALMGLTTDGAHHKQWYLEQIVRTLGLNPEHLAAETGLRWEPGVAP